MGKQQWAVLLLTGILLAVIAFPTSGGNSKAALSENVFEETEGSGTGTDLELRLQNLLENVEGVGRVKVILMTGQDTGIYGSTYSEITGVLIAAEGADNPVTVQNIQQAVMALFQVDAHKIKIMKMK
ncbi:hypothetical protein [Blautia sp. HCP28S3_G10]|uniref:hypothetical protein n=1 Tax=Blautia sp. HCP28S3_G10 TaxID=3438908 RepID=UPI003F893926